MTEPFDVARSWLANAQQETDPYHKFDSGWYAFNALYNQFYRNDERRAIEDFVADRMAENRYPLIKEKLNRLPQMESALFFSHRPIINMRGCQKNTERQARILRRPSSNVTLQVQALLGILYQVRCNLFHGTKHYESDDDRAIMSHAADALLAFLDALLNTDG